MNRKWWKYTMKRCPMAIEKCKAYFSDRFGDTWRKRMQENSWLIRFFKEERIEIHIHHGMVYDGKRFGFVIKGAISVREDYYTKDLQEAEADAFYFAFVVLEARLVQRLRKDKMPNTPEFRILRKQVKEKENPLTIEEKAKRNSGRKER